MAGAATPEAAGRAPAPAAGSGVWRYLLVVGAGCLLAAAVGAGLAVGLAPYRQLQALGRVTYHEEGFARLVLPLTPARLAGLRGLLLAAAALALALLVGFRPTGSGAALGAELRHAARRLARRWRGLPAAARAVAFGTVAGLVLVRGWYLLHYPLGTDEVASYDYFVRAGPAAIGSFYPLPNNHIFFNLLAWPLAAAGLSPRFAMRLPTFVLGTGGTVLGYVLLARQLGWRRATGVTALVGLLPLWVYYGAVGRGYFVQFCLLQIGFFAGLELLRPTARYPLLGWLAFIGSSILGLYTIPTYAYPLASLLVGLSGGLLLERRWAGFGQLALAALVIGLVTGLLYAPVVAVSGWSSLVHNRYVAAQSVARFWPAFRPVLYESAAALFGAPLRFSGPGWLAGALLGGAAVRRWVGPGPRRSLGFLAWLLVALPLLFMAGQRVYAPVRTILYVSYFGYVLAALLLGQLPVWRAVPGRLRWPLLVVFCAGLGSLRLWLDRVQVRAARRETQQLEQAYHWLRAHTAAAHRPTRIWLHAPLHELFFAHYELLAPAPRLALCTGSGQTPPRFYNFAVLNNRFVAADGFVRAAYHPVYRDELVTIYAPNTVGSRLR